MQETRYTINSSDFLNNRDGAFAIYAGIFIFILTISAYAGVFVLNKSKDATQQQYIEQIRQKEEDLRPKLLDQIFSLEKKLKSISAVISSHPFTKNTFALIEKNTHPRVQFSGYSFQPKDRKVIMKGEAQDYETLARQIAFLEAEPMINNLEFGGLSILENKHVSFTLTISLLPSAIAIAQ